MEGKGGKGEDEDLGGDGKGGKGEELPVEGKGGKGDGDEGMDGKGGKGDGDEGKGGKGDGDEGKGGKGGKGDGEEEDMGPGGPWSMDGDGLAQAVAALSYPSIRAGSTDHPAVYNTASRLFSSGRPGQSKVVVMITDGDTHKGTGCKSLNAQTVEARIGKCTKSNGHTCAQGERHNGKQGCDMQKCMCGLYYSELFKDKGYQLIIVGVANMHHIGHVEAGFFKEQMTEMASPGKFYYAPNFSDLKSVLPRVLAAL